MTVYRGHNTDQLTSTSNGGATAHTFEIKVHEPDSYGRDCSREISTLSEFFDSYLREAAYKGHAVGMINDGDIITTIHVLAQDVGVLGIFSDWPATTMFYANCLGANKHDDDDD